MWQLQRIVNEEYPAGFADELFESSSRSLIVAISLIYTGWHFIAAATWPDGIGKLTWLPTAIFLPTAILAYLLVRKRYSLAQLIWLSGMAATITAMLVLYQWSEVAFFYALLPIIAIIAMGWPAALAVECLVILLLWSLIQNSVVPDLTPFFAMMIVVCSIVLGVVGWISTRTLLTVLQWSLNGWEEARKSTQIAREHRAELMHLNIQMDRANHQLDRMNAVLLSAWKAADQAERFKAEFVTNISHEMRTPLNLISGFTHMMATAPESYGNTPLPAAYRSDLNTVYRSSQHLLALVDDVIDMARIDAGKIAMVRYEVDLGALLHESASIVRDYITSKGLALTLEISEDLPLVWIDRLRIRQVLLNLLTNAVRHTKQGAIKIVACQEGEQIVVKVCDTGPGITPQEIGRLFQQFETTEQPVGDWHSGTGLGLPISKKFVELHDGLMGVESEVGQGSCFWFTLPASRDLLDERVSRSRHRRTEPLAQVSGSGRTAIVVAKRPEPVAKLLNRHLERCEIVGVDSWHDAHDLVDELMPVALIFDRNMAAPPTDLMLPQIRCLLPDITISDESFGEKTLLVKPVARHELLAAVDSLDCEVNRVLIVDDEPSVVRLFRRMLSGRVALQNCQEAFGGEEALELMQADPPDLVILDLAMPEVDGQTVMERMALDPKLAQIPVILASGTGRDQYDLRLSGPIEITQPQGFELGDLVRMLQLTLDAMTPDWHHLIATEQAPGSDPAG